MSAETLADKFKAQLAECDNGSGYEKIDVCEAWYLFCADSHEGQGSAKYAALSAVLGAGYKPSMRGPNYADLAAPEIYEWLAEGAQS